MKKYPDWVCHNCGTKYGRWYATGEYTGPSSHYSTCHYGKCDICKDEGVSVTEPRDYGHIVEWDVIAKTLPGEKYNRKKHRKTRTASTD